MKDVEKAIRAQLPPATNAKVDVLTWGNHLATNEYADVPNVILAGTLFMCDSFYTALTHLAQDRLGMVILGSFAVMPASPGPVSFRLRICPVRPARSALEGLTGLGGRGK